MRRLKGWQIEPAMKAKFAIAAALLSATSIDPVNPELNTKALCQMAGICYPDIAPLANL